MAGTHGVPVLQGLGNLTAGGTLVPQPDFIFLDFGTTGAGNLSLGATWPAGVPSGFATYFQQWVTDPETTVGFSASNGLAGTSP